MRYQQMAIAVLAALILTGCQKNSCQAGTTRQIAAAQQNKCRILLGDVLPGQGSETHGLAGYNWQKIREKCSDSPVAAYNAVISLTTAGKIAPAMELASTAADRFPDFQPLTMMDMRLNEPLQLAARLADEKYQHWLSSKSKHSFNQTPPQKRSPSPLPKLIKGEFEKRADFERRVLAAKAARKQELQAIEDEYMQAVRMFNRKVENYNNLVQQEKEERLAARDIMREQFFNEAAAEVFGKLKVSELVYDPEREKFSARLWATKAGFDERIVIPVPIAGDQARSFKRDADSLHFILGFKLVEGNRLVQKPTVRHGSYSYPVEFSNEVMMPTPMSAVASVEFTESPAIETIKEVHDTITVEDGYYAEALSIQDDPELARLRQQRAENENRIRLARAEKARELQRERIKQAIQQQQQQLAQLGGTAGSDYEGLVEKYNWKFPAAAAPATDMVAVIIGNRDYGQDIPKVHYAYNDARAVQTFLTSGLGVPPENIILQKDATKGEMEGLFKKTLPNRVTRGRTEVLVYFSGHGMPKGGRALLLPSDTRPEFAEITGYSRDELLKELAALGAKSTTIILDACFSGTAKDSAPLVAGKPVFAEVTSVAIPDNTIFISATRASEIARMDQKNGMSLMTFHLLQGLSGKADKNGDKTVSVTEIKNYLDKEVQKVARLTYNAEQHPEVYGPKDFALVQY